MSHIPSLEFTEQFYLTYAATDRSHPSSDRAKRQGKVEKIGNVSGAAQIATG
jgi:hypothetical protein